MRQTGKQHTSLIEAAARILTGEKVAFIGVSKIVVESRSRYFNHTFGDNLICEPMLSASKGLRPEFVYDEEGIVDLLPTEPEKLIAYSYKLKN